MSTYTIILYQVVFGSKYRTPFLTESNQEILFVYIAGILRNKKCHPHIVGGFRDHIHMIFDLHPSVALSDLVRDVKKATEEIMEKETGIFPGFPGWQVGYGAFTYSKSAKENLIEYVKLQKDHHNKLNFKEELISLYQEHGVDFDEKYLFT
jgi:putative transposase